MNSSKYLPVGSVVRLKDATRNVVVIGFAIIEDGSSNPWDYLGCAYPIGVISNDKNLLFNIEQIEEVISEGYSDEEDKRFRKELEETMEQLKNNGNTL